MSARIKRQLSKAGGSADGGGGAQSAAARKKRRIDSSGSDDEERSVWTPKHLGDLRAYNRSASEAPAELFRKDLISAMKLPDNEPLTSDDYWGIGDPWKQEWERGVQVPVNPDSLPEPSVTYTIRRPQRDREANFRLTKEKFIRVNHDDFFSNEQHILSNLPTKAEKMCRYDMDNLDDRWLYAYNGERARMGAEPVPPLIFEMIVEHLEETCWENIHKILKTEESLSIEFDEDVICDVCRSPDSEEGNEMVFCDSCNICVHQACYGITAIPSGSWLCRTCSLGIKPDCVLCPNKGGAMKSTKSGQKWAHVACALWIPEVSIGSVERMEPITKIPNIPQSRWALVCVLCRERRGACIQCSVKTCKIAYHVTCAFKHGLEMKAIIEDESADDGVKLRSYCEKHSVSNKKVGSEVESDEGEEGAPKKKKDWTSEQKNQARAAKLRQIESEFYKHVDVLETSNFLDIDFETTETIFNYWKLKRRAGFNKPLLTPRSEEIDLLPQQQEHDIERMKTFVHLRQYLERVRNLCYMVNRRERLSRSYVKSREQTFSKQASLLSSNHNLSAHEIKAIMQANHGPSVYDQMYSSCGAPVHTQKQFEKIVACIAGTLTETVKHKKKPKNKDVNGIIRPPKYKNENPYKKLYINGAEERRSRSSSMHSTTDSDSSLASTKWTLPPKGTARYDYTSSEDEMNKENHSIKLEPSHKTKMPFLDSSDKEKPKVEVKSKPPRGRVGRRRRGTGRAGAIKSESYRDRVSVSSYDNQDTKNFDALIHEKSIKREVSASSSKTVHELHPRLDTSEDETEVASKPKPQPNKRRSKKKKVGPPKLESSVSSEDEPLVTAPPPVKEKKAVRKGKWPKGISASVKQQTNVSSPVSESLKLDISDDEELGRPTYKLSTDEENSEKSNDRTAIVSDMFGVSDRTDSSDNGHEMALSKGPKKSDKKSEPIVGDSDINSDSENKESTTDSQNHAKLKTKGAVKEYTQKIEAKAERMNRKKTEKSSRTVKKSASVERSKAESKTIDEADTEVGCTKNSEVEATPGHLFVPQRKAAKKASELITSQNTSTSVATTGTTQTPGPVPAATEPPPADAKKTVTKPVKEVKEEIEEPEIIEEKVPEEKKVTPTKGRRSKSAKDKTEKVSDDSKGGETSEAPKKNLFEPPEILPYVPMRQAAKKAAENLKGGNNKGSAPVAVGTEEPEVTPPPTVSPTKARSRISRVEGKSGVRSKSKSPRAAKHLPSTTAVTDSESESESESPISKSVSKEQKEVPNLPNSLFSDDGEEELLPGKKEVPKEKEKTVTAEKPIIAADSKENQGKQFFRGDIFVKEYQSSSDENEGGRPSTPGKKAIVTSTQKGSDEEEQETFSKSQSFRGSTTASSNLSITSDRNEKEDENQEPAVGTLRKAPDKKLKTSEGRPEHGFQPPITERSESRVSTEAEDVHTKSPVRGEAGLESRLRQSGPQCRQRTPSGDVSLQNLRSNSHASSRGRRRRGEREPVSLSKTIGNSSNKLPSRREVQPEEAFKSNKKATEGSPTQEKSEPTKRSDSSETEEALREKEVASEDQESVKSRDKTKPTKEKIGALKGREEKPKDKSVTKEKDTVSRKKESQQKEKEAIKEKDLPLRGREPKQKEKEDGGEKCIDQRGKDSQLKEEMTKEKDKSLRVDTRQNEDLSKEKDSTIKLKETQQREKEVVPVKEAPSRGRDVQQREKPSMEKDKVLRGREVQQKEKEIANERDLKLRGRSMQLRDKEVPKEMDIILLERDSPQRDSPQKEKDDDVVCIETDKKEKEIVNEKEITLRGRDVQPKEKGARITAKEKEEEPKAKEVTKRAPPLDEEHKEIIEESYYEKTPVKEKVSPSERRTSLRGKETQKKEEALHIGKKDISSEKEKVSPKGKQGITHTKEPVAKKLEYEEKLETLKGGDRPKSPVEKEKTTKAELVKGKELQRRGGDAVPEKEHFTKDGTVAEPSGTPQRLDNKKKSSGVFGFVDDDDLRIGRLDDIVESSDTEPEPKKVRIGDSDEEALIISGEKRVEQPKDSGYKSAITTPEPVDRVQPVCNDIVSVNSVNSFTADEPRLETNVPIKDPVVLPSPVEKSLNKFISPTRRKHLEDLIGEMKRQAEAQPETSSSAPQIEKKDETPASPSANEANSNNYSVPPPESSVPSSQASSVEALTPKSGASPAANFVEQWRGQWEKSPPRSDKVDPSTGAHLSSHLPMSGLDLGLTPSMSMLDLQRALYPDTQQLFNPFDIMNARSMLPSSAEALAHHQLTTQLRQMMEAGIPPHLFNPTLAYLQQNASELAALQQQQYAPPTRENQIPDKSNVCSTQELPRLPTIDERPTTPAEISITNSKSNSRQGTPGTKTTMPVASPGMHSMIAIPPPLSSPPAPSNKVVPPLTSPTTSRGQHAPVREDLPSPVLPHKIAPPQPSPSSLYSKTDIVASSVPPSQPISISIPPPEVSPVNQKVTPQPSPSPVSSKPSQVPVSVPDVPVSTVVTSSSEVTVVSTATPPLESPTIDSLVTTKKNVLPPVSNSVMSVARSATTTSLSSLNKSPLPAVTSPTSQRELPVRATSEVPDAKIETITIDDSILHQKEEPVPKRVPIYKQEPKISRVQEKKSPRSHASSPRWANKESTKSREKKSVKLNRSYNKGRGRGGGRGRGKGHSPRFNSISVPKELVGTVYDFDFDNEFDDDGPANNTLDDLRKSREKRQSVDTTPQQSSTPTYVVEHKEQPTKKPGKKSKSSHKDKGVAKSTEDEDEVAKILADYRNKQNSQLRRGVHSPSPPPEDTTLEDVIKTPDRIEDIPKFSSDYTSNISETKVTSNSESRDSSQASDVAVTQKSTDHNKSLLSVPTAQIGIDDRTNQLKLKIKGPYANSYSNSNTAATSHEVIGQPTPTSTTSTLRRMRKKELIRQYCYQDQMPNEPHDSGPVNSAPNPTPQVRTGITIPKAVASMTSIPTREDYKMYTQDESSNVGGGGSRRKRLPRERFDWTIMEESGKRNSDVAEGGDTNRKRPRGSKEPKNQEEKDVSCAKPPPKLRISLGKKGSEVTTVTTDTKDLGGRQRPPKKRLAEENPMVKIKNDSMKFREQIMAAFDKPGKKGSMKGADREKKAKKRKVYSGEGGHGSVSENRDSASSEKHDIKVITGDSVSTPKLVIRFGKGKSESLSSSRSDKSENNNSSAGKEERTDSDSIIPQPLRIRLSLNKSDSDSTKEESSVPKEPLKLKLSRRPDGYVASNTPSKPLSEVQDQGPGPPVPDPPNPPNPPSEPHLEKSIPETLPSSSSPLLPPPPQSSSSLSSPPPPAPSSLSSSSPPLPPPPPAPLLSQPPPSPSPSPPPSQPPTSETDTSQRDSRLSQGNLPPPLSTPYELFPLSGGPPSYGASEQLGLSQLDYIGGLGPPPRSELPEEMLQRLEAQIAAAGRTVTESEGPAGSLGPRQPSGTPLPDVPSLRHTLYPYKEGSDCR